MKWLSLFANVGIAETYLAECGIDIVVANELLPKRCRRYTQMYPHCTVICGDITDPYVYDQVLNHSLKCGIDFVLATPPCQGMSIAGKMISQDPRNSLIVTAIQIIKELQVWSRIIENVPQMISTSIKIHDNVVNIWDYITQQLGHDYHITIQILDTADYGTPQHRRRAIILWSRCAPRYPPTPMPHVTVSQAIWHLPSLESGQKSTIAYHYACNHNADHIRWMQYTPCGQTAFDNPIHYPSKDGRPIKWFRNTYKRIDRDRPAPTITMANGSISSQNNVHPGRPLGQGMYSDARVLSIKEIMILSGLPDDRSPPVRASPWLIRKAIGEWIPPQLIKHLVQTMPICS